MWTTKTFKTRAAMQKWIDKYGARIQWHEIFINNAYGIEYRPLRRVY